MEYIALGLILLLTFVLFVRSKHVNIHKDTARRAAIERRKGIVIEYLKHHGHVSVAMIEDLLEVSYSTAQKYLRELEAEGKIKEIDAHTKTARYVFK